jgi:hypothetical protein
MKKKRIRKLRKHIANAIDDFRKCKSPRLTVVEILSALDQIHRPLTDALGRART